MNDLCKDVIERGVLAWSPLQKLTLLFKVDAFTERFGGRMDDVVVL